MVRVACGGRVATVRVNTDGACCVLRQVLRQEVQGLQWAEPAREAHPQPRPAGARQEEGLQDGPRPALPHSAPAPRSVTSPDLTMAARVCVCAVNLRRLFH